MYFVVIFVTYLTALTNFKNDCHRSFFYGYTLIEIQKYRFPKCHVDIQNTECQKIENNC